MITLPILSDIPTKQFKRGRKSPLLHPFPISPHLFNTSDAPGWHYKKALTKYQLWTNEMPSFIKQP